MYYTYSILIIYIAVFRFRMEKFVIGYNIRSYIVIKSLIKNYPINNII